MSKITFVDPDAFLEWLRSRKADRYEIYVTPDRIIASPTVSTRPVLYGVLVHTTSDIVDEIRDMPVASVFDVTKFEFGDAKTES